jgi:S1-C subfamily serine protease
MRAPLRLAVLPTDELMPVGIASGVLYSADGYILTNNPVAQQAERVTVPRYDRRMFEARVVARDPSTDVAVVQIPGDGFPFAPLGDSWRFASATRCWRSAARSACGSPSPRGS